MKTQRNVCMCNKKITSGCFDRVDGCAGRHDVACTQKLTITIHHAGSICTHLGVTVLVKLLIPEVGVELHLVDSWRDLGILQQVLNLLDAEVGDTNALHQTFLDKLFHLLPCFLCITPWSC